MAGSRIDAAMKLVQVHRKLGGRLIQDKYPSHYMPGVGRQVAGAYATKGFVDEAREEIPAETVYDPMGNVAMPGTAAPSDEKEPARGSRILEGFSKGFGHGPLGFSEENKLKYPLTTGTWQPFVAPVDALLRLPGGIAGAAAGAVGAGTEAVTGDEGFANRAERQARDFADFLMIEAGQVRPRAPTHTPWGEILAAEKVQRPMIERSKPPTIEGDFTATTEPRLLNAPEAPTVAPEPIRNVPEVIQPAPEVPRAAAEPIRNVPEPIQTVQNVPEAPVAAPREALNMSRRNFLRAAGSLAASAAIPGESLVGQAASVVVPPVKNIPTSLAEKKLIDATREWMSYKDELGTYQGVLKQRQELMERLRDPSTSSEAAQEVAEIIRQKHSPEQAESYINSGVDKYLDFEIKDYAEEVKDIGKKVNSYDKRRKKFMDSLPHMTEEEVVRRIDDQWAKQAYKDLEESLDTLSKPLNEISEYESNNAIRTINSYVDDIERLKRIPGFDERRDLVSNAMDKVGYKLQESSPTTLETPAQIAEPAHAEPAPMTRSEANQRIKELRQSMAGLEKDSPEFKAIQEQMKEINLQVKSAPQEPSVAAPAPVKEVVPAREAPPRNISPLGLYSHGVESAHLLPMDKGTPQQIKKMLETKFSVKPTELEGFDEAFAGKNLVTREEVVKFFEDNRPQLEEVQYGGKGMGDPYEEMHNAAQRIGEDEETFYRAVRGYDTPSFAEFRDAEQRTNWFLENRPEILDTFVRERLNAPARFEDRTEPGGENYRVLLIKRKEPPKPPPEYVYKVTGAQPGTFATRQEANDYVTRLVRMRQTARNDPSMVGIAESLGRYPIQILTEVKPNPDAMREGFYYEAHYPGQRDVLAAPRLKDRYDTEGNKILNAEEIQSDYAQVGQDKGFKAKKDIAEEKRLKDDVVNFSKEIQQSMKDFNELYDEVQLDKIREAYKNAPTPHDLPNAIKQHEKYIAVADPQRLFNDYRSEFLRRGTPSLSRMSEEHLNKMQDAYERYVGAREAHQEAVRKRDAYIYESNKGVDPAPYVTSTKDWVDLVLKRLLKEAVDGGYKKFVWTPAEQQFGRWGSEMVRWEKVPGEDGAWMVDALQYIRPDRLNKLGKMNPKYDDVITSRDELFDKIDYAIGDHKKAAAMADKAWARMQKEESGSILPRKEGMEGFYGNKEHTSGVPPIVYARMKALLSKIDPDVKIAPHEVITHAEGDVDMSGFDLKYPDKLNTTTMPGVEITPKMIEAVRKGLPERARGGSVVDKAMAVARAAGGRTGYANEGAVRDPNDPLGGLAQDANNPNQWLQFGGQDQGEAPKGVPISEESSAVLKPMGVDLPQEAKTPLIARAQSVARLIKSDQGIAPDSDSSFANFIPRDNPQRSKNFDEWFGDSLVKNKDGTPKTVYHGTSSDFSVFRPSSTGEFGPGIYATDLADEASSYAGTHPEGTGQNVMPVHIRMEQPFVAKDPSDFWEKFGGKTDADAIQNARKAGYDGVIIERPYTIYDEKRKQFYPTGRNHTHYVVFDPGQIKSAIGNSGKFSLKDLDINKNEGGKVQTARKGLPARAKGGSIVDKALMLKSPSGSPLHEAIRIAKQHRGTPRKS